MALKQPELEIFIEGDSGNIYNGNFKDNKIIWKLKENKINADVIFSKDYLLKIVDAKFKIIYEINRNYGMVYQFYTNNYELDNESKKSYTYQDILKQFHFADYCTLYNIINFFAAQKSCKKRNY